MSDLFDELHLFCRIIEAGSLRAAATELELDPSNVSRRLVDLERRVGVKLVHRSRVRSTATDAGQAYYRGVRGLLDQFEALEAEINGAATEPRGLLRVAAPSVFGARHVGPWLHELQREAPNLRVELLLGDHDLDLVEHRIDLAIRIGQLRNSSLVVSRLGLMDTGIVASAGYVARVGVPKRPEELEGLDCVLHANPLQDEKLVLEGPQARTITVTCRSGFHVSSMLGVLEAVRAGAGFNAGPLWVYADAIDRGELVQLLPRWKPPRGTVNALVIAGAYRPAKITAALAMLRRRVPQLAGIRPITS